MTIQELREKRAKAWDTARDFLDSKRQADGTLSEEDSKTYDAMEATIVNLGKEIQRMERQAEIEAEMAKATTAPILTTPTAQSVTPEKTGTASAEYSTAFWNSIRNRNFMDIRNDLQIGTDSEGGYLVPDEFERKLIEALQEENIFRQMATVIKTSSGDRKIPIVPQYYIEDDHEAIIPKDIFMRVQEEMARRSSERDLNGRRQGFSANHAFSHMVTCECCGEHFRRLHWNNRGKKTIVWRCKTRLEDRTRCMARTVSEDDLQQGFIEAINRMIEDSEYYIQRLKGNMKIAIISRNPLQAETLAARMRELQQELIDRTESGMNYDDLSEEILRLRELQEQTNMDEAAKNERKKRIRELANFIDSQPRTITEFDEALAKKLLEGVRVGETYLEFQFKSGARMVVENE